MRLLRKTDETKSKEVPYLNVPNAVWPIIVPNSVNEKIGTNWVTSLFAANKDVSRLGMLLC